MKRLPTAIAILVVATVLAIWPMSRGVWQASVGRSALWVGQKATRVTDSISSLLHLSNIDKRLKEVEEENSGLRSEIAELQQLKQENETLRKELKLRSKSLDSENIIGARIISRSPANFLQTYVVDAGSDDGVAEGQTVIASGYLVGQIKSVTPRTSEVSIISSGQLILPVALQGSHGTGVVRGGLEGLTIEEVPLDTEVKEGELVVTQDLEGIVVPNIPVGTVRSIQQRKGDIFQRVIAETPLDFSRLSIVSIIKN